MQTINQEFQVNFSYDVHFTGGLFQPENPLFSEVVQSVGSPAPHRLIFVLDRGMLEHHPTLQDQIHTYLDRHSDLFNSPEEPIVIPGGEEAKNEPEYTKQIVKIIESADLDRHSFVVAAGGGAVIDTAGFAASIAHRGIRLIRIPTTVLAQNDASIGVKNGINAFGKKNYLGTFTPPFAVINDQEFLSTLSDRDWRSGIAEAVKVALIKDASFFDFIQDHAESLSERDDDSMRQVIHRCAELHLNHIATSGDPFEMGSARPLDFGHWAAHKLEQLTNYRLRHGEAVAIGIALDCVYANMNDMISNRELDEVLEVFRDLGFDLYVPELSSKLDQPNDPNSIFHGLNEFREHLGGELTIMLLETIGNGVNVNEVHLNTYRNAIQKLRKESTT